MYRSEVISLDNNIEELVVLKFGAHILACFAAICPYPIEVGGNYPVALHPFFIEDPEVIELSDECPDGIEQIGDGFGCWLTGRLQNGGFSVGDFVFFDEYSFSSLRNFEGKKLKLAVDRMDAEFLES